MTPAPFSASADTKPRSIRSMRIGARPVLMTCPPRPQMIGRPPAWAARIAATIALKSAPPSRSGKVAATSPRAAAASGRAKSATRTLLGRDASG
jgi:hypothetical protein